MEILFFKYFFSFIISFSLSYFIIFSKTANNFFTQYNKTKSHHLIKKKIPRFGSISIFFTLILNIIFLSDSPNLDISLLVIIAITPFFLIGILEDFTNNISPYLRLLFSFFPGFYIFFFGYFLNNSGISFFDFFLNNFFILIIVTVLYTATLSHAFNIIDGLNGLASGIGIIMFLGISIISYSENDYFIFNFSNIMIFILLGFFVLNWPFGKIFLGDSGSYLIGSTIAIISLIFINRNPEYNLLLLLPLLSYPFIEISYITIRRLINGKHIFKSDQNHIHHIVYFYFIKKNYLNNKNLINSLSSLVILIIYTLFVLIYLYFLLKF